MPFASHFLVTLERVSITHRGTPKQVSPLGKVLPLLDFSFSHAYTDAHTCFCDREPACSPCFPGVTHWGRQAGARETAIGGWVPWLPSRCSMLHYVSLCLYLDPGGGSSGKRPAGSCGRRNQWFTLQVRAGPGPGGAQASLSSTPTLRETDLSSHRTADARSCAR